MKMIETEFDCFLRQYDPFESSVRITEKVDGSALRFGLNKQGDLFLESATSPPMFSVGDFEARDKSKGYDGSIGRNFDFLLQAISRDTKLMEVLRKFSNDGIKIIGEIMFMPMARAQSDTMARFIRIPYFKVDLGYLWTFVPIMVLDGKGNRSSDEFAVFHDLVGISTSERKYVLPNTHIREIDLTSEIENINRDLYELNDVRNFGLIEILSSRKKADKVAKAALKCEVHKHQVIIRDKILSYMDRGLFGPFIEGLVIEFPDRTLLKVITDKFIKEGLQYGNDVLKTS
jgi:hypothetical protein